MIGWESAQSSVIVETLLGRGFFSSLPIYELIKLYGEFKK
jgi:hypothetical protein